MTNFACWGNATDFGSIQQSMARDWLSGNIPFSQIIDYTAWIAFSFCIPAVDLFMQIMWNLYPTCRAPKSRRHTALTASLCMSIMPLAPQTKKKSFLKESFLDLSVAQLPSPNIPSNVNVPFTSQYCNVAAGPTCHLAATRLTFLTYWRLMCLSAWFSCSRAATIY